MRREIEFVRFDDALHYGQAETGAAPLKFARLPESIEHVREVSSGDADSRIRYPESNLVLVQSCADSDVTTGWGELKCVADEVIKDLEQTIAIGPHVRRVTRHLDSKVDGCCCGDRLLSLHSIADQLTHRHATSLNHKAALLDAGNVHKVLNHPVHSHRRTMDRKRGIMKIRILLRQTVFEELLGFENYSV